MTWNCDIAKLLMSSSSNFFQYFPHPRVVGPIVLGVLKGNGQCDWPSTHNKWKILLLSGYNVAGYKA